MKRKAFLFALIVIFSSFLFCLDWPILNVKPLRFFGQRNEANIERGIVLEHEGIVRSCDDGIVLFYLEEKKNMSGFPNALGNTVFIYHDDDLMTVYANLKSLDRIENKRTIETGSILADDVASGWGNLNDFTLIVVDQKMKKILNPLMLLPPLKDSAPPTIKNVSAVSNQSGQIILLGTTKSLKQGKWHFYAEITDTIDSSKNEYAPFRISTLLNGREVSTIAFEVLTEKDGKNYLQQSSVSLSNPLYKDAKNTYLGEIDLVRGRADIIIIASDIGGNERTVSFVIQVE